MKIGVLQEQRISNVREYFNGSKVYRILNSIFSRNTAIAVIVSFLLGRASMSGGIMPFGIAFFASVYGIGVSNILVALSVILGMITTGAGEQIYVAALGMLLFHIFNIPFKNSKAKASLRHAVLACISVLIPELITACMQGFLFYDVLKAVLHGLIIFLFMLIFNNALVFFDMGGSKKAVTSEEVISMAIVAALALSGLVNIQIGGFVIRNILTIFIVIIFSYKCGPGAGSAIGVAAGLIISVSSDATPLIIGSYAFCGLLAGIFRKLGKVGTCLGFVIGNAVLTLYLNGSTEIIIHLKEIVFAVAVFLLIPEKLYEELMSTFNGELNINTEKRSYSARIKEITVEKLAKFSLAFKELSKTFSEISETKAVTDKQDISVLIDRVADSVCKDCSLCLHCWDRNFYSTYQTMFQVIEALEEKGWVSEKDIPGYFLEKCERVNDFVKAANNAYEIFKVDMMWKSKISESRELVSQQLDGLSKAISNLSSEINVDITFRSDIEDHIVNELSKAGIRVKEAVVYENKWGKYEINILHKGCGGKRSCISQIESIVSKVVGRKVSKEHNECYHRTRNSMCTLKLVEEETFRVTTGVAQVCKFDSSMSGDSYTFMNSGEGQYIVAISDGMGSGQKASSQSRATINLIEQFMESGFDKDTTIKLINSILMLKSSEDSFTTIDLSVIDLYGGEVEFIKIGAVPTYIKRSDKVELLKSASLPAGILSNLEMELIHKKLADGDFLIMLSDGVVDSFNLSDNNDKELLNFIQSLKSTNPQEIADIILAKACENCGGKPLDDMMVLASKFWKRVG